MPKQEPRFIVVSTGPSCPPELKKVMMKRRLTLVVGRILKSKRSADGLVHKNSGYFEIITATFRPYLDEECEIRRFNSDSDTCVVGLSDDVFNLFAALVLKK